MSEPGEMSVFAAAVLALPQAIQYLLLPATSAYAVLLS